MPPTRKCPCVVSKKRRTSREFTACTHVSNDSRHQSTSLAEASDSARLRSGMPYSWSSSQSS